jgi:hypothetical protein
VRPLRSRAPRLLLARRWLAYVGYPVLTVLSVLGAFVVYVALVFIGR